MAWTNLGTVAPGDVLRANSGTAAYNSIIGNLNEAPRGYVGQATSTTINQSTSTTGLDLTGITVTWTAEASRWYRIELIVPRFSRPSATAAHLSINEGATVLQRNLYDSATVADYVQGSYLFYVAQFSAGSHTVKGVFGTAGGSGTVTAQSSGHRVALLVSDLGKPT
jgi:hypothetical protein